MNIRVLLKELEKENERHVQAVKNIINKIKEAIAVEEDLKEEIEKTINETPEEIDKVLEKPFETDNSDELLPRYGWNPGKIFNNLSKKSKKDNNTPDFDDKGFSYLKNASTLDQEDSLFEEDTVKIPRKPFETNSSDELTQRYGWNPGKIFNNLSGISRSKVKEEATPKHFPKGVKDYNSINSCAEKLKTVKQEMADYKKKYLQALKENDSKLVAKIKKDIFNAEIDKEYLESLLENKISQLKLSGLSNKEQDDIKNRAYEIAGIKKSEPKHLSEDIESLADYEEEKRKINASKHFTNEQKNQLIDSLYEEAKENDYKKSK